MAANASDGEDWIRRVPEVVMSTNRLHRVVDYEVPNLTVTVQAGVTVGELQRTLAAGGSRLPLDPPFAASTLGGVVAANQSGPKRLAYGSARDLVLGLRVVLPEGDTVRFGGKVMKNIAGFDMSKLFVGSWGTLGIITEITLRVLPRPESEKTLLAAFSSLDDASRATGEILASQLLPPAIELVNPSAWDRVAGAALVGHPAASISRPGEGYLLVFGLEGFQEAVERQGTDVVSLCTRVGAWQTAALEGAPQGRLWSAIRDSSLLNRQTNPWTAGLKSRCRSHKWSASGRQLRT